MSDDVWWGVSRDEYEADRLLSMQDEADWRAARGDDGHRRPSRDEMVARWGAERAAVMAEYEPTDYGWWNSREDDE